MAIRRQSQTILESAARTTLQVSNVLSAEQVLSSIFSIDVTVDPSSAALTFTIEGKDPESALADPFYTILVSATINGVGTTTLQVGPTIIAAANTAANEMLPKEFRVSVAVVDSDSMTYSVGVVHMVEI